MLVDYLLWAHQTVLGLGTQWGNLLLVKVTFWGGTTHSKQVKYLKQTFVKQR